MKLIRALFHVLAVAVLVTSASSSDNGYSHTFDRTGNAYSSQNDTGGGNGLFAKVYDNFTLGSSNGILEIWWTGAYFNPPARGPITGWTIQIYSDAADQPGSLLYNVHFGGNGNETFLGVFGGFPTYTYDVCCLNFAVNGGTQYWLSLYPDLGFPPQWGWSSASNAFGRCDGCDGLSYQDFFGSRSPLAVDMAFTLPFCCPPPLAEPGSFALLSIGLLGVIGISWRSHLGWGPASRSDRKRKTRRRTTVQSATEVHWL